ncbi:tRNA 4-thiouridine(8) synthase ThiI, partial [Klebsiella pneumoniae]
ALVTGEALGQVSSQTLTNLRLIDNVSDTLILRPLISHDKEHIDFSILGKGVEEASNIDIREIAQQTEETVVEVETVTGFGANDAILDIRSID